MNKIEQYAKAHDWYKETDPITAVEHAKLPRHTAKEMVLHPDENMYYKKNYNLSENEFNAGVNLHMAQDIADIKEENITMRQRLFDIVENTKIMKYIMIGFAALTAINVICTISTAIKFAKFFD